MEKLALPDETRTATAENFGWVCVCSDFSDLKIFIEDFSLESKNKNFIRKERHLTFQ